MLAMLNMCNDRERDTFEAVSLGSRANTFFMIRKLLLRTSSYRYYETLNVKQHIFKSSMNSEPYTRGQDFVCQFSFGI